MNHPYLDESAFQVIRCCYLLKSLYMSKYPHYLLTLLLTLWTVNIPAIAHANVHTTLTSRQTISPQQSTGIVKRVDDIAAQITVRIEDKQGHNGSGVIIGKSGNTYSVMTAAHVVAQLDGYSIVTPSRERVVLRSDRIKILNRDLDLAVVTFTSRQNYRTATLANYPFNNFDWVFVSGFPGRDVKQQRYLSVGAIQDRSGTDFGVKDRSSLSHGNNLIYTNLSLPGMSGGAVLDRQGRLIGINTGAENEQVITKDARQEELNFGFSLGIPTATILDALSQGKVQIDRLNVTSAMPGRPSDRDRVEIKQHLAAALPAPLPTSPVKDWLDYGNLVLKSGDSERAIKAFDRAISRIKSATPTPDRDLLKLAYFGKGLALSLTNHRQAAVTFQAAIAVDPQFVPAWHNQGRSLEHLQQYAAALTSYQKAIELDPQNFIFYVEQGDILRSLNRNAAAIKSYDRAIALQPSHPWAYNNRGSIYNDLKQYPQALADFNKAIQLNPQDVAAHYNRGLTYSQLQQYPCAIANFDRAIQLNPQLAAAYQSRGSAHYNLKQYPRAIADLDRAIQLAPKLATTYENRGEVYFALQQYPQALADYNRALALDPKLAIAYTNRGVIYYSLSKYPDAIADYNRSISIDPQIAENYKNRGDVYSVSQQYPQAIADFTKAIALKPQFADAYNSRGIVYHNQQQYPQAIADCDRAIQLNPELADAYTIRGFAHMLSRRADKAKADWEMAARLFKQQGNQSKYQLTLGFLQKLAQLDR
jgi:tetratricopeptide (TPR) repeat protein